MNNEGRLEEHMDWAESYYDSTLEKNGQITKEMFLSLSRYSKEEEFNREQKERQRCSDSCIARKELEEENERLIEKYKARERMWLKEVSKLEARLEEHANHD